MSKDSGELIELPNGKAVYFVDDHPSPKMRHSYWRAKQNKTGGWSRSTRLTGVTTAISPTDWERDGLMNWAAKMQLRGVVELIRVTGLTEMFDTGRMPEGDTSWMTDPDRLWREVERRRLTWDEVRDEAGQRGSRVHESALRALAEGAPTPDYEQFSEAEKGYVNAVTEFWLDNNPTPLNVEQVVCDESIGVAGRFDLRCKLNGKTVLLDAKTSRWIGHKDHVQLAGYESLAITSEIGSSDERLILHLRSDGGYELIPVEAGVEDFTAALDVYRRVGKIKKAAQRAREDRGGF